MKINRNFYNRDGLTVSEELLGKTLVHITEEGITKGKIVEVEAYMGAQDNPLTRMATFVRNGQKFNTGKADMHMYI